MRAATAMRKATETVEALLGDPAYGQVEILKVTVDDAAVTIDYVSRNRAGTFHHEYRKEWRP